MFQPDLPKRVIARRSCRAHEALRPLCFETLESRQLLAIDLVSGLGVDGKIGNNYSSAPSISADGRYVVFQSAANNLVSGDTNNASDVFVKDMHTGNITRVSANNAGAQANDTSVNPSISADGRYVAFHSRADNLVSGDTNSTWDIFVKDLLTGNLTWVNTDSAGGQANGDSFHASMSADGRYVAFSSVAENLVSGDTNLNYDIFVKDLLTGNLTRASTDSAGAQANKYSLSPSISANGRYVAFMSESDNLVSGDTNFSFDVFVKDMLTGNITRANTDSAGTQANKISYSPNISANGRFVAFSSVAENLVSGDTNASTDIFVKDLLTGTLARVSTDSTGGQIVGDSAYFSMSDDGRYVAFVSDANNLVSGDTNNTMNVFVKDVLTDHVTRLSTYGVGTDEFGYVHPPSFSADGEYVAFTSWDINLVSGDTNGVTDVLRATNDLVPSLTATLASGQLKLSVTQLNDDTFTLKRERTALLITTNISESQIEPALAAKGVSWSAATSTMTIPLAAINATGKSLLLDTGGGDDTIQLDTRNGLAKSLIPRTGLELELGDGNDTLTLINNSTTNSWWFTGAQQGELQLGQLGKLSFRGLENAIGGNGPDLFRIANNGPNGIELLDGNGGLDRLQLARDADMLLADHQLEVFSADGSSDQTFMLNGIERATINGGVNDNLIDARAFTGDATIIGGSGNDVIWGGSGNDTLRGSNGNDTLLGGDGHDWVSGGAGNDILLGDNGADILVGGRGVDQLNSSTAVGSDTGADLLIGGSISFGEQAVDAIRAAWVNPGTYTERITKLRTGVGTLKQYQLTSSNILEDNARDILFGGTGNDWFWAGIGDTHDKAAGELLG